MGKRERAGWGGKEKGGEGRAREGEVVEGKERGRERERERERKGEKEREKTRDQTIICPTNHHMWESKTTIQVETYTKH